MHKPACGKVKGSWIEASYLRTSLTHQGFQWQQAACLSAWGAFSLSEHAKLIELSSECSQSMYDTPMARPKPLALHMKGWYSMLIKLWKSCSRHARLALFFNHFTANILSWMLFLFIKTTGSSLIQIYSSGFHNSYIKEPFLVTKDTINKLYAIWVSIHMYYNEGLFFFSQL